MAYRRDPQTIEERVAELERRLRAVEQPGGNPPDPGWVLTEVGNELLYTYRPTGASGPIIGVK